jgi:ParB/RepB/Spo0J family partition protein
MHFPMPAVAVTRKQTKKLINKPVFDVRHLLEPVRAGIQASTDLPALKTDAVVATPETGIPMTSPLELICLPINRIEVPIEYPTRQQSLKAEVGLRASIREHGQIQPILVREVPRDGNDSWQLVSGYRRLKACQDLELREILAIRVSAQTAPLCHLIENLQREDLAPVHTCISLGALKAQSSMTDDQIGQVVGLARNTITHTSEPKV